MTDPANDETCLPDRLMREKAARRKTAPVSVFKVWRKFLVILRDKMPISISMQETTRPGSAPKHALRTMRAPIFYLAAILASLAAALLLKDSWSNFAFYCFVALSLLAGVHFELSGKTPREWMGELSDDGKSAEFSGSMGQMVDSESPTGNGN